MATVRLLFLASVLALALPAVAESQPIDTPSEFFGFEIGTDGELARYPKVLEYLIHLADRSERVNYEVRGTTTNGHPYVLVTFSAKANLDRLDRLVEINHQLSDPRGLPETEARALTREGVPFYFLYATIHSTEVGNGQSIIRIAHRLATEDSPEINEILDNTVVLLTPSQNPDGQVLVVDHWYETRDTAFERIYPDLYHRYAGHDNNRDWFMFTQKETRMAVDIHSEYRPTVTHDMHQMGSDGARIFVPPFREPADPNIHPLLIAEQAQIGMAMSSALVAAGKTGIVQNDRYDLWTPARQYMLYHGQPRILTEIASARLADPLVNPAGADRPLGPQESRADFPVPYDSGVWRLSDIVEYGEIAVFAGLEQLAQRRTRWLENFYRVHKDWVDRDEAPYAFVIPADQSDPFETYELLNILDVAEVEIHQARSAFTAGGISYAAGSWVIDLAQPYGAFAKTMLEEQIYPDLRRYPGGPPIPPYDVTAHTLGLLMGVHVDTVDNPLDVAGLELLDAIQPKMTELPERPEWAYALSPTSNAGYKAVAQLQAAGVPVFRAGDAVTARGEPLAPGAWIVPPTGAASRVLEQVVKETGLVVSAMDRVPEVSGYALRSPTRVGLWRAANNIPAGWMRWLFEQYELDHQVISSLDFDGDLAEKYDVIVLPSGTTRSRIVNGLSPRRHDESWRWAYGVGEEGWEKLRGWVKAGGTLIALGTAVETARDLLSLPIEPVLPRGGQVAGSAPGSTSPVDIPRGQRAGLQSSGDTVEPTSIFYCPGALLHQEHDAAHPIGFGMADRWPVFFRFDQAYRLTPSVDIKAEVVSRYPDEADMSASGWLLGDELLRNQANVISFDVDRGTVVTMGSQVAFRTQARATFKLLFNAIFQGPATPVDAETLATLQ